MIQFASLEGKRRVPADPPRAASPWKRGSIVIEWGGFSPAGVLVCQSVAAHLLIVGDSQITDILHHEAVTHVRCHFFYSYRLEQKGWGQNKQCTCTEVLYIQIREIFLSLF